MRWELMAAAAGVWGIRSERSGDFVGWFALPGDWWRSERFVGGVVAPGRGWRSVASGPSDRVGIARVFGPVGWCDRDGSAG